MTFKDGQLQRALHYPAGLGEEIGDSALCGVMNFPAVCPRFSFAHRQKGHSEGHAAGRVHNRKLNPKSKKPTVFALNATIKFLGTLWNAIGAAARSGSARCQTHSAISNIHASKLKYSSLSICHALSLRPIRKPIDRSRSYRQRFPDRCLS